MAGIVRKSALNYARKMRGRKTTPADPVMIDQTSEHAETSVSALSVTDASTLPDDQAIFDDDVLSALKSLGADARCCLLLRVVEELSYHDISELMEIPEGTAMSHVHRAKAALRQRLGHTKAPQQADVSQDA
jgi:RNA polymerase sigma-70 factor (ECF subfamily)